MAIVTSYDWESDTWAHHTAENAARTAWREAVAEIAEKAKATLPDCAGCVDAAIRMVLAGDVEPLEDGTAKVASQSNGQVVYHVVNGACSCKDYAKAPSHWCKHRIAAGLYKRATALVQRQRWLSTPTVPVMARRMPSISQDHQRPLKNPPSLSPSRTYRVCHRSMSS